MLISAAAPAEKVLVFMNPAVTVKENYEFRRIYRKGKSAVSPQLVIYCQRNRRGLSRWGSPSARSWAAPWSATG